MSRRLTASRIGFLRQVIIWRRRAGKYRYALLSGIVLFGVVLPIIIARAQSPEKVFNSTVGYEMQAPLHWRVIRPATGYGIIFEKPSSRKDPGVEGIMRLDIEFGNPWGGDAMNYLKSGIIPGIINRYPNNEFQSLRFDSAPFWDEHNGISWAMTRFTINLDEVQVIAVTLRDDIVIISGFKSTGEEQEKDEKLFYRMLDSLKLDISAENLFLQNPQAR